MIALSLCFLNASKRPNLVPERIKIEPVERRETRIMLQPRDVALHPRLDFLGPMLSIQHDLVGEMFEENIVGISAGGQPEEKKDGATHRGSKQNRPSRQGRRRANEMTARCFIGAENAIA